MRLFLSALVFLGVGCAVQTTAPAPQLPTVKVEVWHDTVCPWCRIGLHNLEAAVANTKDARVEVVHHAFLLEPDAPAEGVDLRARLGSKYGADRLEAMFARVTQAGAASGVRFNWDAVRVSPSSAPSHALIEWAPAERRGAVLAGVHRAYFEEGKNLGDPEVLAAIAQAAGLDAVAARAAVTNPARLAAVRSAAQEASARGITGVPYFVIGGRVLNGAQARDDLRAAIAAARVQGSGAQK